MRPASSVAESGDAIVGCAELAPLSGGVAEVRSLVVDEAMRGQHIGLGDRSIFLRAPRRRGGSRRCAPSRTSRRVSCASASLSFRTSGCRRRSRATAPSCALFRHCGQYAVMLPLRAGCQRPARAPRGGDPGQPQHRAAPPQHRAAADEAGGCTRRRNAERRRGHAGVSATQVPAVSIGMTPIEGGMTAPQGVHAPRVWRAASRRRASEGPHAARGG